MDVIEMRFGDQPVKMGMVTQNLAVEGLMLAIGGDIWRDFTDPFSEIKGWFEGVETKRRHINEFAADTIAWLKDEDKSNPKLSLDMGTFKTWMKTSETFFWRYYFVLNDGVYNEIVSDLKKNNQTQLEGLADFDMKDRQKVTRMLDSAKEISDLLVIVEKYRARCNVLFDLFQKRKTSVKSFPFQVMLLGLVDLNRTVKKIVNLAT